MRFEHKSVVLCGAAHGIGRATARRFSQEGASLALLDHDAEALAAVAESTGGRGWLCDLTQPGSVRQAMDDVVEHLGAIDVLVNVAGGDLDVNGGLGEDAWSRNLELNLRGPVRLIDAALPHLTRTHGNVVLVGSLNAETAFGGYSYSSAKAGLPILVKNLASDYGRDNVRFNVVAPGSINTSAWKWSPTGADVMLPTMALPRAGRPEDVAAAVAFLASEDASWITGVTLPVDGGQGAGPKVVINAQR